jgi:hypothetical protein
MTISWEQLKDSKLTITVGSLLAVAAFIYQMHQWAQRWHFANFITVAAAQEQQREVEEQVAEVREIAEANQATLEDHVGEFRLFAAITRVSQLEERLDRHQATMGDSPQAQRERDQIKRDLDAARTYQACIFEQRENCHLLLNQH